MDSIDRDTMRWYRAIKASEISYQEQILAVHRECSICGNLMRVKANVVVKILAGKPVAEVTLPTYKEKPIQTRGISNKPGAKMKASTSCDDAPSAKKAKGHLKRNNSTKVLYCDIGSQSQLNWVSTLKPFLPVACLNDACNSRFRGRFLGYEITNDDTYICCRSQCTYFTKSLDKFISHFANIEDLFICSFCYIYCNDLLALKDHFYNGECTKFKYDGMQILGHICPEQKCNEMFFLHPNLSHIDSADNYYDQMHSHQASMHRRSTTSYNETHGEVYSAVFKKPVTKAPVAKKPPNETHGEVYSAVFKKPVTTAPVAKNPPNKTHGKASSSASSKKPVTKDIVAKKLPNNPTRESIQPGFIDVTEMDWANIKHAILSELMAENGNTITDVKPTDIIIIPNLGPTIHQYLEAMGIDGNPQQLKITIPKYYEAKIYYIHSPQPENIIQQDPETMGDDITPQEIEITPEEIENMMQQDPEIMGDDITPQEIEITPQEIENMMRQNPELMGEIENMMQQNPELMGEIENMIQQDSEVIAVDGNSQQPETIQQDSDVMAVDGNSQQPETTTQQHPEVMAVDGNSQQPETTIQQHPDVMAVDGNSQQPETTTQQHPEVMAVDGNSQQPETTIQQHPDVMAVDGNPQQPKTTQQATTNPVVAGIGNNNNNKLSRPQWVINMLCK